MTVLITGFRDACGVVIKHLHARYGISVEVASIEPPLKGDPPLPIPLGAREGWS